MDTAGAALFRELLSDWTDADRRTLAILLDRFCRRLDDEPTADRTPVTSPAPAADEQEPADEWSDRRSRDR